ncbi:MAG: hypothetical protein EON96_21485 [Caulobacteraceae bacterium]|nr:MAG: hypothetical protein EON96_21485 [Caulobacteraceae bacterium]
MFDTPAAQIGAVFVCAVCLFAFWQGDEPERFGASAYLLGWFASLLLQRDGELYAAQWALVAIDIVMFLVLVGLLWKCRRSWPAWAAGFQLLSIMSHLVTQVDDRPSARAFLTIVNLSAYGVLVALAIGTFWAWQEREAAHRSQSWDS